MLLGQGLHIHLGPQYLIPRNIIKKIEKFFMLGTISRHTQACVHELHFRSLHLFTSCLNAMGLVASQLGVK
jgi:hypothetical protein